MEPALVLPDLRGPAVDALSLGVAPKIEHKRDPALNWTALVCLRDRIDVGQLSRPAVLALNGGPQLSLNHVHLFQSVWSNRLG